MMFAKRAGQFAPDGGPAYQWGWRPQAGGRSRISWGDPKPWPPASSERFLRSGDWVLLDGYTNGSTDNFQRVTSEQLGDSACRNLRALPSDGGRQHYVRWRIPATGYCLRAQGTINAPHYPRPVRFQHNQVWYPPSPCSVPAYPNQVCIRQHEEWYDDNGHAYSKVLERDQYLARGLGMAFRIDTSFNNRAPADWHARMTSSWNWQ